MAHGFIRSNAVTDIAMFLGDSPAVDSFGRLRVSMPTYVFDGQLTYDLAPLIYEQSTTGSGATITLNAERPESKFLSVTGRLAEAVALLRERAAQSPACLAGVRYGLACYECLSGNLDEAKRLIAEEITADPEKKKQALEDDDLTAIRKFIQRL